MSLKLDPSNAEAGQRLERAERLLAAADFAAREEQAGRANDLIDRAEAALAGKRWGEAKVACEASLPLLPTGAQHHRKRAAVLLRLGVATASLGDVGASRRPCVLLCSVACT